MGRPNRVTVMASQLISELVDTRADLATLQPIGAQEERDVDTMRQALDAFRRVLETALDARAELAVSSELMTFSLR